MKMVLGRQVFDTLQEMVQPSHTAVLVIDMQNDFAHGDGASARCGQDVSPVRAVIPHIRRLVEGARASGVLVVHIQNTTLENGRSDSPAWLGFKTKYGKDPAYCMPGSWGHRLVEELQPASGEPMVHKYRSSGFTHTNLDHILRNSGIETVVCCGCITEGCVESTVRDASFHDYYTLVASDAVGSFTRKYHDASLMVMGSRYPVHEVDRYLEVWRVVDTARRRAV